MSTASSPDGTLSPETWHIEFVVPKDHVAAYEYALEDVVEAVLAFEIDDLADLPEAERNLIGQWRMDALLTFEPDKDAVAAAMTQAANALDTTAPAWVIRYEAPRDWLSETARAFPPFSVGRFWIYGSHVPASEAPAGSYRLLVDAATAFGSGEHQSTTGCLLALNDLAKGWHPAGKKGLRVLDMGCGSGILAMAAARCWPTRPLAVDLDPEAVRVTLENTRLNGLKNCITARAGNGFATPAVAQKGPYDLIMANILARPLASMAKDLAAHLAPGGRVVLAGLLAHQEAYVRAAYRAQGLHLLRRRRLHPWVTLELAKKGKGDA